MTRIEQFRTGLDRLARIVGHVIIRVTLVLAAAGILLGVADAMGMGDQVAAPAPAPTSATPAAGPVVGVPAPGATAAAPVAATATAAAELAPAVPGLVAVHSHDVTAATWLALVDAGALGAPEDKNDNVIYATPQMMLDAVDDLGSR